MREILETDSVGGTKMKKPPILLTFALTLFALHPVSGQDAVRESLALTYPEGPTLSVKFQGTFRLPRASGEAKVERKRGTTEIEVELDEMKPATSFGGDYNTYVLWVVSPEGHVDNVGEFILRGNRSKLNVSTPLETFGMFVTAEPHFLVGTPSRFVVLENTRPTNDVSPMKISRIKYRSFEGTYNFDNESLANTPEAKGEVRTHLEAARTAVELAERAGAEEFAPEQLADARAALQRAERGIGSGIGMSNQMLLGQEVVRLAVEAQKLAEERAFEAALQAERDANAEEIRSLEVSIQQAQSEAERARLETQQRELELRIEEEARQEALERAAEAARRAAEAEEETRLMAREKAQAELQASASQRDAEAARREAEEAQQRANELEEQRQAARQQLQATMSQVLEIRESARGLILSLPDILFDFDKATLKPQTREILAKLSGVLSVIQGYRLSIEGHTDSIGSEEYNQVLSEKRAQAVQSYLSNEGGLRPDLITSLGFGESQPVADNTSPTGRQKNRRVEIVVEEMENFGIVQQ